MALRDHAALDETDFFGQPFRCDGFVSFWASSTPADELEPGTDALQDLAGVGHYDPDFQEVIVAQSGQPEPIENLLAELTDATEFLDEAALVAKSKGLGMVLWVLAQYDFIYDPRVVKRPISPALRYIGALPYQAL